MTLQVGLLLLSIVALYFGAELALEAAEQIGRFFGLSPFVIGLVLIGFGTSLPEMFVSQLACFRGHGEIAMGNIVGSNIANLFLILGVAGLFVPLHMARTEIRHQLIIHVVLTSLLAGVLFYGQLNWMTFTGFAVFFSYYLWDTFRQMKKQRQLRAIHDEEDEEEVAELTLLTTGKLFAGFALLYFGGEWLVSSGSSIAKELGISEYVISAVFVAFGTSFPELVTALIACLKKKNTDLITGNIIGSNVFNVSFVMGSLGIYNLKIVDGYQLELILLGAASLFLLLLSLTKWNFARLAGILFLGGYGFMVFSWIS